MKCGWPWPRGEPGVWDRGRERPYSAVRQGHCYAPVQEISIKYG